MILRLLTQTTSRISNGSWRYCFKIDLGICLEVLQKYLLILYGNLLMGTLISILDQFEEFLQLLFLFE